MTAFREKKDKQSVSFLAKASEQEILDAFYGGMNINAADDDGETALVKAVKNARTEAVSILLKLGAKPDAQDKNVDSALIIAVKNENAEIVDMLLTAGANVNARDKNGKTALTLALEQYEKYHESAKVNVIKVIKVIKMLVDAGAEVDSEKYAELEALMSKVQNCTDDLFSE